MFGAGDWVRIRLVLQGAQKYAAQMYESAKANLSFARSTNAASVATQRLTRNSFLHNQVMFTGRRLLFYTTLGALAAGGAIVKLGFSYANTMQQARVALLPMFKDTKALDSQLNKLFAVAALTPFQFQDVVTGFTQMLKAGDLGAAKVTSVVQAVSDILSATPGKATASNMNRVTTALSHMINLGRPTGQVVLQLARLGIPIKYILLKQLGATEDQLKNISSSGITSVQVMNALISASKTMPRFVGQALKSQLNTFSGVMSTFRDFLAQASAGGVGGPFMGLFKLMRGVDIELGKINAQGKNITLTDIITIFDKKLSPSTHLILNLFILLEYTVKGFIGTIMILAKVVQLLLWPLDHLASLFGANKFAMKLLGIVIGTSIALWGAYKTALLAVIIVEDLAKLSTIGLAGTSGLGGLAKAVKTLTGLFRTNGRVLVLWRILMGGVVPVGTGGKVRTLDKLMVKLRRTFIAMLPALTSIVAESWAFTASLLANPITWIVLAVVALIGGLVVLYFKWKRFHDAVNGTVRWFKANWYWAKYFMGVFGPLGSIIAGLGELARILKQIVDTINHPLRGGGLFSLARRVVNFTLNPATRIPVIGKYADPFHYFGKASGGMASGWNLVGERGPEMVHLPQGSRVFNQTQLAAGYAGGGGFIIKVYPQSIYFDRQKIGEVIAGVVTDREARL